MTPRDGNEAIRSTRNAARFCVEHRAVSWMLLAGVMMWGVYSYATMPKRKDPEIPVRVAVAICPWPGVNAQKVEQMVTRRIEAAVAQNSSIHPAGASTDYGIRSVTLDGVAIVYVQLSERISDSIKQFNDISLKLNSIDDLPSGAGPIQFHNDFGDTAALMLTIASPKEGEVALALRAHEIRAAIQRAREQSGHRRDRVSLVTLFPESIGTENVVRVRNALAAYLADRGLASEIHMLDGSGFAGFDAAVAAGVDLKRIASSFITDHVGTSVFPAVHPDAWAPVAICNPVDTEADLTASAGDKYTYRELDRYSDLIQRTLETLPDVDKVSRSGVLPEWIQLAYSQRRIASYGVTPSKLAAIIARRNTVQTGGRIDAAGSDITVHPTGEFTDPSEIGNVIIQQTGKNGAPLYLRDLVDVLPGYENPPRLLNFYTWHDSNGRWHRDRAITLGVFMRPGAQISEFGQEVGTALGVLKNHLPEDLMIERTSDQPRQVHENIDLLMRALYEAIALVILVAWIGFWEWRSALLIALSIPITLAMTFGMMHVLGIDLQQVSIATLIIALGLLVDDPVVAGDAIQHELRIGKPRAIAAWLGPTKLGRAILFATITNVVAYLPFLMLSGDTGKFLYSLPIVMTCALLASRIVSMTFIPHLGYYLMRPGKPLPSIEYRRTHGVTGIYYRIGTYALAHRKTLVAFSVIFLGGGLLAGQHLRSAFFPEDVQYLAYIDAWLPNGASISETNTIAREAEETIKLTAEEYGREHPGADGKPREVLKSVTTFVGGGGLRFWFSEPSESEQPNYAQLIFEIYDKDDMPSFVGQLQTRLSATVPGAYLDVRQLLTNPVQYPIEIHVSGQADVDPAQENEDIETLHAISDSVEEILRSTPGAQRVRTDWMEQSPSVELPIDAERANFAGVTTPISQGRLPLASAVGELALCCKVIRAYRLSPDFDRKSEHSWRM